MVRSCIIIIAKLYIGAIKIRFPLSKIAKKVNQSAIQSNYFAYFSHEIAEKICIKSII